MTKSQNLSSEKEMSFLDHLEELVQALTRRGEEITPIVYMGSQVIRDLNHHAGANSLNAAGGTPHHTHHTPQVSSVCTSWGYLTIRLAKEQSADYIGINGRTLIDIIVEETLLGDDH